MKPKAFVAAAAITFQGSIPCLAHTTASSLTSAMFTIRNVFWSSFASSAERQLDSTCTSEVSRE